MPVQTTYGFYSAGLIAGQLADNGHREVNSVIAEAAIAAGIVGIRGGTTRTEVRPPTSPDAADVDGIATAAVVISAATAQTIAAASFDGVVGAGEMFPPRNVTLTLSNSADWDATTAVVTGTDEDGRVIQESLLIPNGGNATVTGLRHFCKGRIAVNCETSYTDGNPVFVRFIASGDEVAGHVRASADANDCAFLKRARFVGSGSSGIAVIDLQ